MMARAFVADWKVSFNFACFLIGSFFGGHGSRRVRGVARLVQAGLDTPEALRWPMGDFNESQPFGATGLAHKVFL